MDIFYALEHVAKCSKAVYGESEAAKAWLDRMRMVLLSEGVAGMERELLKLRKGLKKGRRKAVESLLRYLEGNRGRLNYCERLRSGRVIGSGLIEGACKKLVGRRLKQTGACWRLERANKIARLVALIYANQWKIAWIDSN